ncbi:GNAT family N-acetyltransferase, partial [Amycolatopsis rhizosphaerae]
GAIYAREYGWDSGFEALVARIVADYVDQHDPRAEAAWIAEIDGERVGSVFCVRGSDERTAKLRLLLVEPGARGYGLGRRLVEECVAFARAHGYTAMELWTNDVLTAARHIYAKTGFRLVESEPHHSFGHDLVGETWRLKL